MNDQPTPTEPDTAVPPGAAQDTGPLRGEPAIEPEPAKATTHPTGKAEERSETVRPGGEAETRDDR